MSTAPAAPPRAAIAEPLSAGFLVLLPTLVSVARHYFRHLQCLQRKDDCVAEAVGLAWRWYIRLIRRGRDPAAFIVTFARRAATAAASGRRVAGQESSRDVMSRRCQQRHGYFVATFPDGPTLAGTAIADALVDNTRTPVPDQAQFRTDFPVWKRGLTARTQHVVEQFVLGFRTGELAQSLGRSAARISQMRGELCRDYLQFLGDAPTE